MTSKQKLIASCLNPYYDNYATKKEVKIAKRLACGRFWYDTENYEYCAFSPGGKRYFFTHSSMGISENDPKLRPSESLANKLWRQQSKECAKLWANGKCKEALNLYCLIKP